jgi:hypothetical protein
MNFVSTFSRLHETAGSTALSLLSALFAGTAAASAASTLDVVHVWEPHELAFATSGTYANPYADVELWVDLAGPGGRRRVRGFWNGGKVFKVRLVGTEPGTWTWTSGSNQQDGGLSGKTGTFQAVPWTEAEKQANPNRRGFVRATPNGHALSYADGTPFFLFADTWWSAGTRIWSWGSAAGAARISFQEAVAMRKRQGYNSIAMIAAFPNWAEDGLGPQIKQGNVIIRAHGWKTQDTVDENGARPFAMAGLQPHRRYKAEWFNPTTGQWTQAASGAVHADDSGACPPLAYPDFGDSVPRGWALKLTALER